MPKIPNILIEKLQNKEVSMRHVYNAYLKAEKLPDCRKSKRMFANQLAKEHPQLEAKWHKGGIMIQDNG